MKILFNVMGLFFAPSRRNKIIGFLGIILAVLLLPKNSLATGWYVDKDASGANNGTSWANAWISFSAVVWGGSGVKAGDILYISGGSVSKTYTEKWTVGASGTSGNPITIMVGQDAGHNGGVIFDFGGEGTGAGLNLDYRSYILIDGNVSGQRKLTIKNFYNTSERWQARAISGMNTAQYIEIRNVNFDNVNNAFRAASGTGYNFHHNYLTGIRGDGAVSFLASTGTWDANLVHDNYIGLVWNNGGPDGIQNGHGTSVYNNTFRVDTVSYIVSTQHTDYLQSTGDYVKVYNNDFINIGDSGFDSDASYFNFDPENIWIYNNTFRIVDQVDIYPEYIRFYNCNQSLNNVKIFNNTFIDNEWLTTSFYCGDSCTATGNEYKNNIFYNVGPESYRVAISITGASFQDSSWSFDYNIYWGTNMPNIRYLGTNYTAVDWVAAKEPHGKTNQPLFVSYTPNGSENNLRLSASDTVARDAGLDLSSYFTIDKDGVPRPQGSAWDIGAYEYIDQGVDDEFAVEIEHDYCKVYGNKDFVMFSDIGFGDIIRIYDVTGRLMHDSDRLTATSYRWNLKNVASGVYFYVIKSQEQYKVVKGKIALIK